ncbi:hypothetical protein DEU56DRAFT_756067 [Suillus clintonianus]|uniref:uncharacterized protein n=1 Tax=Suillus clintonianus TaxID=1904413 RepID=UPI001B87427E|nr:uncharacterized protein DEU56DRAFT_756067 [Suillus clintonianus]KAG2137486.1 hypothetical protein DEU56DRAFT_756067 [Suillus clintonianus]
MTRRSPVQFVFHPKEVHEKKTPHKDSRLHTLQTLDTKCTSSPSSAEPGDLSPLVDTANMENEHYRLNPLWSENISDSLPPELQPFLLPHPVRTQNLQDNQIDPGLLSGDDEIDNSINSVGFSSSMTSVEPQRGLYDDRTPASPPQEYIVSPGVELPPPVISVGLHDDSMTPSVASKLPAGPLHDDWMPLRPPPVLMHFGSMPATVGGKSGTGEVTESSWSSQGPVLVIVEGVGAQSGNFSIQPSMTISNDCERVGTITRGSFVEAGMQIGGGNVVTDRNKLRPNPADACTQLGSTTTDFTKNLDQTELVHGLSSDRYDLAAETQKRTNKNASKPAAAPAANPSPRPASVRPAALEVVVACALAVPDADDDVVVMGEVVGVGKVVKVLMDESTLCTTDDSEETMEESEESTEDAAVVSKETVLRGSPLDL